MFHLFGTSSPLFYVLVAFFLASTVKGFQSPPSTQRSVPLASSTTIEPPTREERRTADDQEYEEGDGDYPDMEYLIDSEEFREFNDPFHILLMGSTFEKPKISISYVAGSLEYVLGMPTDDATELSTFAAEHGMSCLGCWPRAECLQLGRKLQVRDIICRVVPYAEGGQRGWQAKDAASGERYAS